MASCLNTRETFPLFGKNIPSNFNRKETGINSWNKHFFVQSIMIIIQEKYKLMVLRMHANASFPILEKRKCHIPGCLNEPSRLRGTCFSPLPHISPETLWIIIYFCLKRVVSTLKNILAIKNIIPLMYRPLKLFRSLKILHAWCIHH